MIAYRTFRNGDLPALARIWNAQPCSPRRLVAMTPLILDEHVLARTYFDPAGFVVATDGERPVGFVHAGFGPTADGAALDRSVGATLVLMVEPRGDQEPLAAELLRRAEGYLRAAGARRLAGGNPHPMAPFYWGTNFGSGILGVLDGDSLFARTLADAGYSVVRRQQAYRRELAKFRLSFDRVQMHWRRSAQVLLGPDESCANWWAAGTLASTERCCAMLKFKSGAARRAELVFWDLLPLTDSWGERAQGLLRFRCDDEAWSDGFAQFVWSESLELLRTKGATGVEAAVDLDDARLGALLATLGLKPSGTTELWQKDVEETC